MNTAKNKRCEREPKNGISTVERKDETWLPRLLSHVVKKATISSTKGKPSGDEEGLKQIKIKDEERKNTPSHNNCWFTRR